MEFKDITFFAEIVLQAKIAKRAAERLEATKNNFDKIEVWCSIQSILGATGNVSKILWPGKKYIKRGERLRQLLKVDDDNIISNRKFRNNFFEHYDARVEEWFINNPNGVYTDLAMNPSFLGSNLNTHRGYNSFNNTLEFRGEILDLEKILNSLEEIRNNCKGFCLDYP